MILEIPFDIVVGRAHMACMDTTRIAARLEALGSPTRLEVYRHLVRAGADGLAVGELQARTAVPRSTLSHHLHKLIAVDLVTQERQGTTLLCRANYPVMQATMGFLERECCADAVADCDAA